MPKSVNKVILVGNVGKFLCPGLAPTKGSKIAAVSGRTDGVAQHLWLGSVWRRSLGSTLPEGTNSTSRESSRLQSGRIGRAGRGNIARNRRPTCCSSACGKIIAVTTKTRPQTTTRISGPKPALARAGTRIFHSERLRDPCTSLRRESCHEPNQWTRE